MKARNPSVMGFTGFLLLLLILASCQPPAKTRSDTPTAVKLLEPQVLQTWASEDQRIGMVFREPISLQELIDRTPGSVEGVLFSMGSLQGAFRSHQPVSAEAAAARVRDYARFFLTRQTDFDRQEIQRLLDRYEVWKYTQSEARALFRRSQEAQAYARTLIERSLNRRYARQVLEGEAPVVYAVEVLANPQAVWKVWGATLEGVATYSPRRRFYPSRPQSVERSIEDVRNRSATRDLDLLFDEAVRILREEYGVQRLFAGEAKP